MYWLCDTSQPEGTDLITALQLLLSVLLATGMPPVPATWRAGIVVIDVQSGENLLDISGDGYFRPASTVKLVTTLLAMRDLGPSYIYRTMILADTSAGDLYAEGAGAPLLSGEHIRIAAMETAAALDPGTTWDLYWDTSRFASESHCPGWDTSDWSKTYCPPIEGLSVGDNIIQLVISTRGGTMRIFNYPPLPDLQLINNLVTGPTESVRTRVEGWDEGRPLLILDGTVPSDTSLILYKPYAGPPAEFAGMLSLELEASGIGVGSVMPGSPPDDRELMQTSVIYSDPMFVLLTSMNKWSRNMVAEMVLRTVSLEQGSSPASTAAGCDAAGRMLTELLPELTDFQLADGSGLSRYNSLTPRHLAAVLMEGIGNPEWGIEFLATLPVNGVDGTLRSRMADLPPGAFRGKTGTLNDTSAIAGLLTASSGRELVVVIMFEVPAGRALTARALQDSIIAWLWETY
jgi:D-alanyl-D-alanine carboxypeptidase/D-alanyl-D-alanine-endopeptidase (penicillin-binding protein 4)